MTICSTGIETLLEELQRQNAEQRELLTSLSESRSEFNYLRGRSADSCSADWRADSTRQHEETIEAVRSTAQEQVPFNVQGVSVGCFFSEHHLTCNHSVP